MDKIKKTTEVPKFIKEERIIDENNNNYASVVKNKIFDKLSKYNYDEFSKFNLTESIYNKYFYGIELIEEDRKLFEDIIS